jgi:ABC-2 type transport system permease protein
MGVELFRGAAHGVSGATYTAYFVRGSSRYRIFCMTAVSRYVRLWCALARYGLIRELSFRGNFLIKVTVEILWLAILLIFYRAVFRTADDVADWNQSQYFFYVGCYFAMLSVLEALFLSNCGDFAELIRTGDLDFYLLKPIDEHSFLLLLTSSSVWLMRNQSLYEIWWLFTSLMRYPKEIFRGWAFPIGWIFTFIIPVLIAVNFPAEMMVKTLHPGFVAVTTATAVVLLWLSRRVFRSALKRYRSASS